jgi:hypothetical protein
MKKMISKKKKYAIFGNCQGPKLNNFLITNDDFNNNFKCEGSYYVPGISDKEIDDLYDKILPVIDLIIIQPINENYRNNYKLSTKSILSHIKTDCIVIIYPSAYFSFYHPYLKSIVSEKYYDCLIHPLWFHHDILLIKLYLELSGDEEKIMEKYLDQVNSANYFTKDFLQQILSSNINELINRENNYINYVPSISNTVHFIKSSKFISENFDQKLLFYTYAHPGKYYNRYISDCILNLINCNLKPYPDDLDSCQEIVPLFYNSMNKILKFNICDIRPATTDMNNNNTNEEYIKKCLIYYKQVDNEFLREIVDKAIDNIQKKLIIDIINEKSSIKFDL